jgi:DNA repair exonuclease SbcCD nuclease subunit
VEQSFFNVSGDMHLERVQYGITARYKDNQKCIEAIVQDTCTNSNCRGIILTGDSFHKKTLLPRFQLLLRDLHNRIRSAGKDLWAIDGNHDGSDASWLDTIDSTINANGRIISLGSKRGAFFAFQERTQLYENIEKMASQIQVLVLHGRLLELLTWAKAQKEPDYDFSAQELRNLGIQHCTVLMGDIHTYSDFYDPVGDNWFIYAGSTEMTEVSEGNVVSERFGNKYDTVKKYIRLFPDRPHGKNWDVVDLPNRPFMKRIITLNEDVDLATERLDRWICEHPKGILALHYPFESRAVLQPHLARWKAALLALFDVPLSANVSKPLQDMKEIDILSIAEKELNSGQIQILKAVLTNEQFDRELKRMLTVSGVE